MSLEDKIKNNIWHTNLEELFQIISERALGKVKWSWSKSRNMDCKYINIRIDMRDGGYLLTNDRGQRIDIEELKYQGEL